MKAQDLSGKVVMMAFGCLWLKYEKKSWINSPQMEVTYCFFVDKGDLHERQQRSCQATSLILFFVLKYRTHVLEDSLMGLALFKHEQRSRRRRYHIIYL